MTAPADGTALYRIFGESNLLLYIGISDDFGARWKQHARLQPWWDEMRRLSVDAWHETRQEAGKAEEAAVKAEQPKYNKNLTKPALPPRPKRTRQERSPAPRQRSVIYVDLPPGEPATRFRCAEAGIRCLRKVPPDVYGCEGIDTYGYPCLLDVGSPAELRDMGVIVRPNPRKPDPAA